MHDTADQQQGPRLFVLSILWQAFRETAGDRSIIHLYIPEFYFSPAEQQNKQSAWLALGSDTYYEYTYLSYMWLEQ